MGRWLDQAERKAAVPRVYIVLPACLAVLILGPLGCGSDGSDDESAPTIATTSAEEPDTAADTGLVGEWSTENVCEDQLRAFKEADLADLADLDDLVSEFVTDYPGLKPTDSDPCHGAKPMKRSHRFGENGSFASYDQNGQQVDDDSYITVDDRTFILAGAGVTVQYRIEGDEATFKVVLPDCTTERCEHSNAYVTYVFFPRVYERTG